MRFIFFEQRIFLQIATFLGFSIFSCSSQVLKLPWTTGPFSVGTKAFEIKDETRTMLRDENFRRWMVQAFYPAKQHNEKCWYMPGTLCEGSVEGVAVQQRAMINAALLKKDIKIPVIFFIPGFGEERQKYTILCEELASYGYVILSLDQPYVSSFIKFIDDRVVVPTLRDMWGTLRDRDYRYRFFDEAMEAVMNDIRCMINEIDQISKTYFDNQLDTKKILLMGHSFGGNVAHTLGFQDKRINAIVDIDSKITERKIFGRVGVPSNQDAKPVFFIRGMLSYQDDVGDQLEHVVNSTIWRPEVEHSVFSDQVYFAHKIPGSGNHSLLYKMMNWFFMWGPLFDRVDTGCGTYDVNEWVATYRKHVVQWVLRYF